MTDRDIEIGRLQASVESLRNQSAGQFQRIDVLEVETARMSERVADIKERLDGIGAPQEPDSGGGLPEWVYDRKTWAVLLAVAGLAAGWWNLDDIKALFLPAPAG